MFPEAKVSKIFEEKIPLKNSASVIFVFPVISCDASPIKLADLPGLKNNATPKPITVANNVDTM